MKTLASYSLSILYLLCAGFCCKEPDEPIYIDYTAEIPNAFFIDDDQREYAVGDTLWVNLTIPNEVTDIYGVSRNINELTNNTEAQASLKLFMDNGYEQPGEINLSENEIIVRQGSASPYLHDHGVLGVSAFLEEGQFQLRFGIRLLEPGTFFIADPYQYGDLLLYFISDYSEDPVYRIEVATTIGNSQDDDGFYFVVNE